MFVRDLESNKKETRLISLQNTHVVDTFITPLDVFVKDTVAPIKVNYFVWIQYIVLNRNAGIKKEIREIKRRCRLGLVAIYEQEAERSNFTRGRPFFLKKKIWIMY
jgi:hypothetical protein